MIEVVPGGIVVAVRVIPRAERSAIAGTRAGSLLVRLTSPPVDHAANRELVDILADVLGVPRRSVTILSGERSRNKRVHVDGIDRHAAARALLQGRPGE